MSRLWIGFCALAFISGVLADVPNAAYPDAVWQEGKHYERIAPLSQPSQRRKIQVVEFFTYRCPHCYSLESSLGTWLQSRADYIEFTKVPSAYRSVSQVHARLYYTLEALGRRDLHNKVFDAIHVHGNRLYVWDDDYKTRELLRSFAVARGIDGRTFDRVYDSREVTSNVVRARELALECAVEGVPTFIVNGKYKTSVARAGSPGNLFAVIDHLAAMEIGALQKTVATRSKQAE